ncbi:unnamed protein product [Effrenium voratum]|nr:unnamed protein product [Effrenium voratum]
MGVEVEVPDECTVGQWKRMLGDGFLGDKILYSSKLQCYCFDKTNVLADEEQMPTLPKRIYIRGPNSVLKMLELALNKQTGKRSSRKPELRDRKTAQVAPAAPPVHPPERTAAAFERTAAAFERPPPTALWPKDTNTHLSVYSAGYQGMRPYMEDRACGLLELPGFPAGSFFGVFDGHGGHQVAQFAAEKMPRILVDKLKEGLDPAEALKESFGAMDAELRSLAATAFLRQGSTAVATLLLREEDNVRLLCANCGDSRAVLCRGRAALALSKDHKPNDPEERRRIEAAGGKVELHGPCWRIDGGLNLSRALGDFLYKASFTIAGPARAAG